MSVDPGPSVRLATHTSPRWRPLESIERRVLGVLIEKAKTTPENYPLSVNSLRSGCNQKNNRAPLMQLEENHVEEALESLRKSGAVSEVQGSGRVNRYRHLAYEWLGVEKVELAVMAELLLRGSQTVGELRGRAARMEPIKDLSDLQPTLNTLQGKGLIQYLTPPGRGAIVTHCLYLDREFDKVRREADALHPATESADYSEPVSGAAAVPQRAAPQSASTATSRPPDWLGEIESLRSDVATLSRELAAARSELESTIQKLQADLNELNRQLGN